jgi:hypothetical protein
VDGNGSERVRQLVERELRVLESRLANVQDDLKELDVTVRQRQRDASWSARIVLRVPGKEIAVSGVGPSRPAALRDAFPHLRDRLDEHLAKLRGEPAIRREGKFHRDKAALAREVVVADRPLPVVPVDAERNERTARHG